MDERFTADNPLELNRSEIRLWNADDHQRFPRTQLTCTYDKKMLVHPDSGMVYVVMENELMEQGIIPEPSMQTV